MKKEIKQKREEQFKSILTGIVLGLTIFLTALVFIGLSISGDKNRHEDKVIDLANYVTEGEEPYFQLTREGELKINQTAKLLVYLKELKYRADGASLVINYDKDKIEIGTIENGGLFDSLQIRKSDGRIEINAYPNDNLGEDFIKLGGLLAKINFVPRSTTSSSFSIVCGGTADSTITYEGENLIKCSANQSLTLGTINSQSSSMDIGGTGGGSTNIDNFTPSKPPSCDKEYPYKPTNLKAVSGPNRDQISLSWSAAYPVTYYGITYGKKWVDGVGPDEYGAVNIGNVTSFTVSGLTPGQIYYFVVYANNDCANSGYSDGASAYAGYVPGSYTPSTKTVEKGGVIPATVPIATAKPVPTIVPTVKPIVTNVPTIIPVIESTPTAKPAFREENKTLATPEPEAEDEEGTGFLGIDSSLLLPIIGGVILILLGILFMVLIKYLKQKEGEES